MGSISSWMLPMKVLLISAGVLSIAMGLRFSVPIATNGIPAIWSVALSWLKPPYLYIVIHAIIITIAASSRFNHSHSEPTPAGPSEHLISVKTPPPMSFESLPDVSITHVVEESAAASVEEVGVPPESEDRVFVELSPVVLVNGSNVDVEGEEEESHVMETGAGDVFVDSTTSTYNNYTQPQKIVSPELDDQLESLFPVREERLVSSRFGHRKPSRTSPQAVVQGVRALRVAKPKRQETLESTWKMITEGRHVPLTRHLKKSDTMQEHHHVAPAVPKSETFKGRSNYQPPANKIRKEGSPSQDDLNRRVEAFIKKFNDEMRMQRQESLNQYMEMINRGV